MKSRTLFARCFSLYSSSKGFSFSVAGKRRQTCHTGPARGARLLQCAPLLLILAFFLFFSLEYGAHARLADPGGATTYLMADMPGHVQMGHSSDFQYTPPRSHHIFLHAPPGKEPGTPESSDFWLWVVYSRKNRHHILLI